MNRKTPPFTRFDIQSFKIGSALLLLFLLPYQNLSAQTYFPLSIGDTWHYSWYDLIHEGIYATYIVRGDTLLGNGKQYADFKYTSIYGYRFMRQYVNKVFVYDEAEGKEHLLLDFSAKAGDTINILPGGKETVEALGTMRFRVTHNGLSWKWTIRDSVGATFIWREAYEDCRLDYAIIGGQKMWPMSVESETSIPHSFVLKQNYPNPFNQSTTINYSLPKDEHVLLKIYDALGQEVGTLVDGNESAGYKSVIFNAAGQGSGVYYCRLSADGKSMTKPMLLMK